MATGAGEPGPGAKNAGEPRWTGAGPRSDTVERMGDERLTKKVYKSEVGGERG